MHPSSVAPPNLSLHVDSERLIAARNAVRAALLAERTVGGHWVGELASSPLATAAAVSALVVAHGNGSLEATSTERTRLQDLMQGDLSELIVESLHWLAERQNQDGGWGDTEPGRSNMAATLLAKSAFRLTCVPAKYEGLTDHADEFLAKQGGIATWRKRSGRDKSLAAPVLANAALAGLVPWRQVPVLPFEYVGLPNSWYSRLQLPVVSYAIPVLVAVGQLKFHHDRPRNPLARLIRLASRTRSLALVERMQPESGGFLESAPLTAFVVMSLAGMGLSQHPVVLRGVEFLLASVRSDASWPIDTNLATWNTTLAINALADKSPPATAGKIAEQLADSSRETVNAGAVWRGTARSVELAEPSRHGRPESGDAAILDENCVDWLLDCQRDEPHPNTGAHPAGWAWTDLPGGVPETDDTAGALVALACFRHRYPKLKQHRLQLAARRGVEWLLDLQNGDGGWPTFCRGWSMQRFDRSASDLTAHAIRALAVWQRLWQADPRSSDALPDALDRQITTAVDRGLHFLENEQRNDGSFVPLWFGNQFHPDGHNLVYGTAQVLIAGTELGNLESDMCQRAGRWLLGVQHANGGWGPPRTSPATSLSNIYRSGTSRAEDALASFCSVEETSLAVEALLPLAESNQLHARAVKNGLKWLVDAVEQGRLRQPSPIGFYFAKLWYRERLYPLVFAASALGQAVRQIAPQRAIVAPVG